MKKIYCNHEWGALTTGYDGEGQVYWRRCVRCQSPWFNPETSPEPKTVVAYWDD